MIALVLALLRRRAGGRPVQARAVRRGAQWCSGLAGGMLLGWGAMTGLGCTVGTLLSGIMAGALSGWVFAAFCTAGRLARLAGPAGTAVRLALRARPYDPGRRRA